MTVDMTTIRTDPIADELIAYRGLSPGTAATYSKAVRQFARWCAAQNTDLDRVTPIEVAAYTALHSRSRENLKLLRQGLRHMWALHPRGDGPDPLTAIRVGPKPRYRCRALDEDAAAVLEAAAARRDDRQGLAVLLGLYLALRRCEIARLRWDDLSLPWVRVYGKRGVTAELPVHPILADKLAGHPRHPSGWVFPGRAGGPVCPTTVWTWVRKVARDAGLSTTTHVLRHTALATANDRTHDLRGVQEFARHARPETTALYTRVTAKRLVQIAMSIDYRTPSEESR